MAMANRKAYFNLDERGKRLFELSQQLAEVHRKNQRLEDEKEFSSKNTYTSNGILPLANNTSLSNSVYTLVQPTQSFGIITGTLIPTNTNTNTSATGLTANISDYSKYFTDANRTITSTLSTWGINQPNNYSAIDLSKVDFSNLNGTYSGEKPKWYQTENTLGLGNTTKLDTNLFKNILQYSQIKN